MTRFGWVLNLDAELELARPGFSYVPRAKLTQQLAEHGRGSLALLGPEDVLISAGSRYPADVIGRAWCPTPRALGVLAAAAVTPEPHPSLSVLRRVNHRYFACEVGGGLPHQSYITEREALRDLLGRAERPWLLKRPLAFAGRGQLRIYGAITTKQWSWIDRSLARDGLVVEPLVQPTLELSLHGFIWQSGQAELGRICVQNVSERGVYRGVSLADPADLTRAEALALTRQAELVAVALYRAGYFGPFGIDAYRYELDGRPGFCAFSEINARYTMGFALGFPRHASELSLDNAPRLGCNATT